MPTHINPLVSLVRIPYIAEFSFTKKVCVEKGMEHVLQSAISVRVIATINTCTRTSKKVKPIRNGLPKGMTARDDPQTTQINRRKKCINIPRSKIMTPQRVV